MFFTNNKYVTLSIPFITLLLGYLLVPFAHNLPDFITEKFPVAPYLVFAITFGLGWLYSRHRVTLYALIFTLAYGTTHFWFDAIASQQSQLLIFATITTLLPFIMTYICSLQDRKLNGIRGFLAISSMFMFILVASVAITEYPAQMNLILLHEFAQTEDVTIIRMPQLATAVYVLAFIAILGILSKHKSIFESGFLASLIATYLAFEGGFGSTNTNLYMMLAGIVQLVAISLNSYRIAYVDELTELPGRRALNEELAKMRGNYAIAMLDVDHFKKFNDNYGHDVGDQVLRMVATKISQVTGGGKAFRYGGEEFSILFPGKTAKAAFPHLSTVRENIDQNRMILRGDNRPKEKPQHALQRLKRHWQEVHITISIGVANNDNELRTPDDVIKAADKALYRAKEKGRNRISQYGLEATLAPKQDDHGHSHQPV